MSSPAARRRFNSILFLAPKTPDSCFDILTSPGPLGFVMMAVVEVVDKTIVTKMIKDLHEDLVVGRGS